MSVSKSIGNYIISQGGLVIFGNWIVSQRGLVTHLELLVLATKTRKSP
ncbi:MAG: hypothetical protein KME28_00670 [Pelatocladus maniniholoensis HA4357-MV3]|uniref:Uncharacterized protein n=1 Tax=Pelatocladus maniniholoensis HA4357-MV3 TaxID=1117104 RepID=A0A9E3H2S4_9NOST|nr:hypothetical protein [Pelatocladus maniniholoensis HA4357-MV3]